MLRRRKLVETLISSIRAPAVSGLSRRRPFSSISETVANNFDRIKCPEQLREALAMQCLTGFKTRGDAVAFYQGMVRIYPVSTTADFNDLFIIITTSKFYPTAITLIKRMRRMGTIPIDDFTLNVLLTCYCRLDRVHYALSVFSTFIKLGYDPPHETAFTVLMNGLIRHNRIDDALNLFDILAKERGSDGGDTDFNSVTQATFLNALFKAGKAEEAIRVLNKIGKKNCDRLVSDTVINGLCKCGQVDAAMTYYSFIRPTVSTFNSLIHGFAKLGRWDDVKRLLREMVAEQVLPNAYTYYLLMDVIGHSGEFEVFKMLHQVISDSMCFDWNTSTPTIIFPKGSGLAASYYEEGHPVEDILKVMEDAKVDLVAYNTVMKVYCLDGRMEEALHILSKGLASRGLCPNISSYNIMIGAYCDRMELDAALQLYREMLPQEGLRPDGETFSCLLKGLLIGGRCDDARVIFHEMVVNTGMVPHRLTYTSLLNMLCNGGKAEEKLEDSSRRDLWYKWLKPDFFHEEIFNRAESLLLGRLHGDMDYNVFDHMISTVLEFFSGTGTVSSEEMELLIDLWSTSSHPQMKQLVSAAGPAQDNWGPKAGIKIEAPKKCTHKSGLLEEKNFTLAILMLFT